MTNRDNLHAKVRAILEKANHPNTPQAEAETALALAFRLMQKYDIDESSVSKRTFDNETVKTKTFTITGQYRVRVLKTTSSRLKRCTPLSTYLRRGLYLLVTAGSKPRGGAGTAKPLAQSSQKNIKPLSKSHLVLDWFLLNAQNVHDA